MEQYSNTLDAKFLRFEEHLTVRYRNDASRLDLWFAIGQSSAGFDWDRAFHTQVSGEEMDRRFFDLVVFPFTHRQGWIVARSVDAR